VQAIAADQELEYVFETPFEPKKAVADPDVRTLMLGRKTAEADVVAAAVAATATSPSAPSAPVTPPAAR